MLIGEKCLYKITLLKIFDRPIWKVLKSSLLLLLWCLDLPVLWSLFLFIFFFFPSVLIAYFGMGCMGTGYYHNVLYTIESLQGSI